MVFEMKHLGDLHHFLGIEVTRTSQGLFLSQSKYAYDLLLKTSMFGCKPYGSPCNYKLVATPAASLPLPDPTLYRSITRALQYLTLKRLELSFAVNQAYQKMHHPKDHDFTTLKRILRYIKGTLSYGVQFKRGPLQLTAFSDVDWAGIFVFLGCYPVSWSAKKQSTVARSSAEAEYRSLAHTAAELSWICMLLRDLRVFLPSRLILWCDNISASSLAANPVFHARTKHVEADYHFVREKVLQKTMEVRYVNTQDQLADIFTKGLHPRRFQLAFHASCH
eukprot:TRINITY_DN25195_c0_g2_i1.p1 TRINITY_DN25195_c0_g2~~TRINITY_DN25195_c0_g2_i1.p1  ORF type:complete len:278 (+),score=33.22 TRINITY_DN25195_c0_g2_i1:2074-2907(+)